MRDKAVVTRMSDVPSQGGRYTTGDECGIFVVSNPRAWPYLRESWRLTTLEYVNELPRTPGTLVALAKIFRGWNYDKNAPVKQRFWWVAKHDPYPDGPKDWPCEAVMSDSLVLNWGA